MIKRLFEFLFGSQEKTNLSVHVPKDKAQPTKPLPVKEEHVKRDLKAAEKVLIEYPEKIVFGRSLSSYGGERSKTYQFVNFGTGEVSADPELKECVDQLLYLLDVDCDFELDTSNFIARDRLVEYLGDLPEIKAAYQGVGSVYAGMIKEIRANIRKKDCPKEQINHLLRALHLAVCLSDLIESLEVNCTYRDTKFSVFRLGMIKTGEIVDLVNCLDLSYETTGHEQFEGFLKTDRKLFALHLGEPSSHKDPAELIRPIQTYAVDVYLRTPPASSKGKSRAKLLPPLTPEEKYKKIAVEVGMFFGYHKQWYERVRSPNERVRSGTRKSELYAIEAFGITAKPFVVADIETTGLDPWNDQIIEIAAIKVDRSGEIIDRFSSLIAIERELPEIIVQITGIRDADLKHSGVSAAEALEKFSHFVEDDPIFFHNAEFDASFISNAYKRMGFSKSNLVYDTLVIAREVFQGFANHKLSTLASELNLGSPNHRAMADAEVALGVLKMMRDVALRLPRMSGG